MPKHSIYKSRSVNFKKKKANTKAIIYSFLALGTILFSTFVISKNTYLFPSAKDAINFNVQKLEAEAYTKYLNQYGLTGSDLDNYKIGTTTIKVFAKGISNDKAYLPNLKLYINGISKSYYEIKNVPLASSFSTIEWSIPYVVKEGDEIAVEYFNDTEANRSKDLYIDNIQVNDRKFYFTSKDNRVWYDRSNRDDGSKYGDQNDFGNSFDNKEVLRFGDYLNFKSGGFNGDMYWNGAIHIQYRADQNTFPQYKAEYVSDKNKNRIFDDAGLIVKNEGGSCKLNYGQVSCSELDIDWKFSSPDDRYDTITKDFFLAKFTKTKFFYPGKYKFSFLVDDGIRFYLDNKLLIDKYNVESKPRLHEVTADITKGDHILRIEHFENTEEASLKFNIDRLSLDDTNLTALEIFKSKIEPYENIDELGDDDKDGLLNIFELRELRLLTDPFKYDSNGNGTSDAYEDTDGDGLINILEQKYYTNPTIVDTDLDGLSDYDEVYTYKTKPHVYDTDKDGLSDGFEIGVGLNPNLIDSDQDGILDSNEIENFEVKNRTTGVKVVLNGESILKEELGFSFLKPENSYGGVENTVIKLVDVINPNSRKVENAQVSIPFDDSDIQKTQNKSPNDLMMVYFDENLGTVVPLGNQKIDLNNKTITADTTHFSVFGLIDKVTWQKIFSEEFIPSIRGTNGKLNVAFVIDDSTSMRDNDPFGDRVKAPVELIDGMKIDDKGAIITFADGPTVISNLTSDKQLLKSKLNPTILKSLGETNMASAIRRSVEVLRADSNEKTARVMIVITDGILDDKKNLDTEVSLAKEHNVIIYTLGLGNGVDDAILKDVASQTGGKYYKLSKSNELVLAYNDIRNKGKDTDGDGLTDEAELAGFRTGYGQIIKTDPNKSDTDGDGLSDGEEYGSLNNNVFGKYVKINSNPIQNDSNNNGVNDKIDKNPLKIELTSEFAKVCYRRLDKRIPIFIEKGSNNKIQDILNLVFSHQQIWIIKDGKPIENIGFERAQQGELLKDQPGRPLIEPLDMYSVYSCDNTYIDASLMKEVANDIVQTSKYSTYNLLSNNCQYFVSDVVEEYNNRKEKQLSNLISSLSKYDFKVEPNPLKSDLLYFMDDKKLYSELFK